MSLILYKFPPHSAVTYSTLRLLLRELIEIECPRAVVIDADRACVWRREEAAMFGHGAMQPFIATLAVRSNGQINLSIDDTFPIVSAVVAAWHSRRFSRQFFDNPQEI